MIPIGWCRLIYLENCRHKGKTQHSLLDKVLVLRYIHVPRYAYVPSSIGPSRLT